MNYLLFSLCFARTQAAGYSLGGSKRNLLKRLENGNAFVELALEASSSLRILHHCSTSRIESLDVERILGTKTVAIHEQNPNHFTKETKYKGRKATGEAAMIFIGAETNKQTQKYESTGNSESIVVPSRGFVGEGVPKATRSFHCNSPPRALYSTFSGTFKAYSHAGMEGGTYRDSRDYYVYGHLLETMV
ncbi:unnamed protein product [Calypogeia fissa]